MKTNPFLDVMESSLMKAWSGSPSPSVRATFYLGVAECAAALKSNPEALRDIGNEALNMASAATQEFVALPWWKNVFNRG